MDRIDEAVVIAMDARRRSYGRTTLGSKEAQDFEAMRAAILAGMKVLLGPVVKEWRESSDQHYAAYDRTATNYNVDWSSKSTAESLSDCADQLESIYTPSLGEGDGR